MRTRPMPSFKLFGPLLAAFVASACCCDGKSQEDGENVGAGPAPGLPSVITAEELAGRIRSNDAPAVLDVRSDEEFAAGHIPNAIHIPHTQLAERNRCAWIREDDRDRRPLPKRTASRPGGGHPPRSWLHEGP